MHLFGGGEKHPSINEIKGLSTNLFPVTKLTSGVAGNLRDRGNKNIEDVATRMRSRNEENSSERNGIKIENSKDLIQAQ